MAVITPPSAVDQTTLQYWHRVFKTPWETLVAIGYVQGTDKRMYTQEIIGLTASDGEVQFFGEDVLEPELHNATLSSNTNFYVVSLSASDTGVARCWMVDAAGDETVVDCTLTGITPCLIGSYVHCNMVMYLGGAVQNIGSIFVSTKAIAGLPLVITDQVQLHVGVSRGHGNNPRQKCPNDQVMIFDNIALSADKSDGIHVRMHKWVHMGSITDHKMLNAQWVVFSSSMNAEFKIPFAIDAGEEIDLTIERSSGGTGAVNAAVNWGMYVLRQNDTAIDASGVNKLFT